MENLYQSLPSIVLYLGCFQILWALVHCAFTKQHAVRVHFEKYFIGVGIYFGVLVILALVLTIRYDLIVLLWIHLVGSALALAIYHFYIVALSVKLKWGKKEIPFDDEGMIA